MIKSQNAFAPLLWQIVKTCMIKLRGLEGWNMHDQSAFFPFILSGSPNECWLHMSNNNLEIRIAGDKSRP